MNWAPILIGIAIICYTFAAHLLLLHGTSIYGMVRFPKLRNQDNICTVSGGLCCAITLITIGSVALCYI